MKKALVLLLCLFSLLNFISPVAVAQSFPLVTYKETTLDNGIVIIDNLTPLDTIRSNDTTYARTRTVKQNSATIAVIVLVATFRYDGNSVSVLSKSVTQSDTYDGWNYKQNSLTSSGGTVTLDAKLTKWLVMNIDIDMSITCDKNGNISWT